MQNIGTQIHAMHIMQTPNLVSVYMRLSMVCSTLLCLGATWSNSSWGLTSQFKPYIGTIDISVYISPLKKYGSTAHVRIHVSKPNFMYSSSYSATFADDHLEQLIHYQETNYYSYPDDEMERNVQ